MPICANLKVRPPKPQLALLFIYFSEFLICALNWWWFVSFERSLFGDGLVNAHLGFNIVGCLAGSPVDGGGQLVNGLPRPVAR